MTADDDGVFKTVPLAATVGKKTSGDQSDSVATSQKEVFFLNQGLSDTELREKAAINEHDRNETFRDEFEFVAIWGLRLFCGLVAALIVVWFWHIVMPAHSHWLTQEQFTKIQSLATGGIIASIAAGHVKKRLGQ